MLPVGLYGVAVYAVNEGVAGYLCVNAVGSDWELVSHNRETQAWRGIPHCMLRRVASEVRGDYGIIAAVRSDSQSVGSAFREMLSALDELQQDLPSYCLNHSEELDEPSLRATVFRLLKATAHLRGAVRSWVRSCRAKIGVDRARSEGKPLGRPRAVEVDEGEIVRAAEKGDSISSIARGNGIARSTIRAIIARRDGEVWSLSNDERLALILACEIASSHETEVVQRLESRLDRGPAELEFRTLPRGELAESIKQRRELVAKFDELREKLRCVNIDARPDNSPKSPMPSIGPGAESSVQANLDPLPEGEDK